MERELDEELRSHIEQETERLIANGVPVIVARDQARRAFGNVEYLKEESRDARGVRVIDSVVRDLAYSLRLAGRQPIFALAVILSLALGIGAATAVFSLTYNALFATLAVPRAGELTMLARIDGENRDAVFSREELRAIHARPELGTFAATRGASQIAIELGTRREYVNMQFVEGALYPMLGVAPKRGRVITPADDDARTPVAVLSAGFAERIAPGDSAIVGKTITIRGEPFTVIGVMPPSFRGLDFPSLFTVAIPMSTVPL
ncbi:MAG: ABC transporter permease, partial [Solirubrobacteraceae bacterium]